MRAGLIWLLIFAASAVTAEDWERLDGPGIEAALTGKTLVYDGIARQTFGAGGETVYTTDRPSQGRWAVRAGQYCSVWPPSDTWACYDVARSGDGGQIRFTASDRSSSVGLYAE